MPRPVSLFDIEPVFELLRQGRLLITSNQRLASRIQSAYLVRSQEEGVVVTSTPLVFSLNSWIQQQWQWLQSVACEVAIGLYLLEPEQELAIWEQIVSDSPCGQALLRPAATAQQAANAYRLMVDWRLSLHSEQLREQCRTDEDASVWLQWAQDFERYCQNHNLIVRARLPELLLAAVERGELILPEAVYLVGFQDIAPLQLALLDRLGSVTVVEPEKRSPRVSVVACSTPVQEIQAAAVWAKQILKNEPAARIAVVVPELNQQRNVVERIFMEVFEPGYNMVAEGVAAAGEPANGIPVNSRKAPPFNLSAGYPLLNAPVIQAAMDLLSLTQSRLELATIEAICHSPFGLSRMEDVDHVVGLLEQCRKQRSFSLSAAYFRQLVAALGQSAAEEGESWPFADALLQTAALCRPSLRDGVLTHQQWAELFNQLLSVMGWPGTRTLDSIEYQQISHWQQQLESFVRLSAMPTAAPVTLAQALSQLRGLLSRQIFQPQTAESPLQILGLLEASGLQFSHLWLSSMSSQHWPPVPTPNPLLPLGLQRSHGMPHSSPDREYRYALELTRQFLNSAGDVVVSFPQAIDDNPVKVSDLFSAYQQRSLSEVLGRSVDSLLPLLEIKRRYLESQQFEEFTGGNAPPVEQGAVVAGGSSVLANQSACPFRAFSKHRLNIESLDEPQLGLTASDRGSLLHRALELFWNGVHGQQKLLEFDATELAERCRQVCQYAVEQFVARSAKTIGPRFRNIEIERLFNLLIDWMEIEKERAAFEVVATEKRGRYIFCDLSLETRIDRVDRLSDGSYLLIDYKTGKTSVADWWGDRPEQPQLPLYALLYETAYQFEQPSSVSGIALAEVSVNKSQFKGAGDEECPETLIRWSGKHKQDSGQFSWEQQKRHWRKLLAQLSVDFINGKAEVDPKYPPSESAKTCQFCQLKRLCRVDHQELQ